MNPGPEAAPASPAQGRGWFVVTRPQPQADAWVRQCAARGAEARALPLLVILPAADPAPVEAAWAGLSELDLLMFVSPNAVAAFARAGAPRSLAAALAPAAWLACVGPGTRQALIDLGIAPQRIVSPPADAAQHDSEALWAVLQPLRDWRRARVQVVRGEGGREWLSQQLAACGAQVSAVGAYRRRTALEAGLPDDAGWRSTFEAACGPGAIWLLSSAEAVQGLGALLARLRPEASAAWLAGLRALASHPRIAEAARAIGLHGVQACGTGVQATLAAADHAGWWRPGPQPRGPES